MVGKARGYNSADYGVAYRDGSRFEPVEGDGGILRQAKGYKEEAEGCER
jgi:hypothetical protein